MSKSQYRIGLTLDKELFIKLQARADKEVRTMASLAKYLLLKGLEAEEKELKKKEKNLG